MECTTTPEIRHRLLITWKTPDFSPKKPGARLSVASHPIYKNGLDSLFHVRGLHDTLGKLNQLQLGKSGRTQVGLVGGLHAQTQVISDGNGRSLRTIEIWWIFNCHAIMLRSVVSCKLKTDLSFHNPGVDKL